MTHRREDVNIIESLRTMDSRLATLETGKGIRRNNMRIGDWIVSVEDGCVVCQNIKTNLRTSSCDCDCTQTEPGFSLVGPYILYDTREWNGHVNITYEVVAGVPVAYVEGVHQTVDGFNQVVWVVGDDARHGLPNLGSAGSAYDLITYETILPGGDGFVLSAVSEGQSEDPPLHFVYDDLGGAPDTSAVTMVIAEKVATVSGPGEFDFFCYNGSGPTSPYFNPQFLSDPIPYFGGTGRTGVYVGTNDSTGGYSDANFFNVDPGTDPDDQVNVVWVITLDVANASAYIWRNGVDMTVSPAWSPTLLALSAFGDPEMHVGIQLGWLSAATGTVPPSGMWDTGVFAAAIYRGIPSADDLIALQTAYGS